MISWFINCKTALLTKNRNTDGHANYRSDSYYTVAFWYHTEPHAPFPPLPPVGERIEPLKSHNRYTHSDPHRTRFIE